MSRVVVRIGLAALLSTVSTRAIAGLNEVGINVNYLNDTDNTPLLSDLMRTYRYANAITSTSFGANDAPLDANGWITTDAWYFLGDPAGIKHGDGTYGVKFTGKADIQVGKNNANGSVVSNVYDPATNTTTAILQTKTSVDMTDVRFVNTQRTAGSATNTGVTNIEIQRPTTPGGNTPYAFGTTFTQQTVQIAQKTSALRFMDYLATNNNTQANWSDRVKPTDVKLNPTMVRSSRGKGGPLELAVQLGNESNRDIWLNVPALATDDYITKMAQTIKYGSDGVNPYTSPQANPKFAPLNPNLHVYLEYSNETWNSQFLQYNQIRDLAVAEKATEVASGKPGPMTIGAAANDAYLVERYNAFRTKQIADAFTGVFGQSALLDTVRPILAWQYGNGSDTANQALTVLDGYYNNRKGNFVAAPKPISSYIYGGGSAMYYAPTDNTSVDTILATAAVQDATRRAKVITDIAFTTSFGIKRVAYEGGLSLDPGGTPDTAEQLSVKNAALADPRLQQLVVSNHNTWTNQGGDLLVYYFSTDQYKFAMSDENFSTTTPKLNALAQLGNSAATSAYSVGTPITQAAATTISGGQFTIRENGGNAFTGAQALKTTSASWTTYLINIPDGGDFNLSAAFKTYGIAAAFQIQLGGAVLADYAGLVSDTAYTNTGAIHLSLPQGITSVRIVLNPGSGDVSLNSITFTPLTASPIPEPAGLGVLAVGAVALRRRRQ